VPVKQENIAVVSQQEYVEGHHQGADDRITTEGIDQGEDLADDCQ
jgi:hypothetical protein